MLAMPPPTAGAERRPVPVSVRGGSPEAPISDPLTGSLASPTSAAAAPWARERVVVVGDDPSAVEAAVAQLEAWGAQPAITFERERALRALRASPPSVVVLDFHGAGRGRGVLDPEAAAGDGQRPPGAVAAVGAFLRRAGCRPAVVVLAAAGGPWSGPWGDGAGRAVSATAQQWVGWAPVRIAPHDDPVRLRAALEGALRDSRAAGAAGAAGSAPGASAPGAAVAGNALPIRDVPRSLRRSTPAPLRRIGRRLGVLAAACALLPGAAVGVGQALGPAQAPAEPGGRGGAERGTPAGSADAASAAGPVAAPTAGLPAVEADPAARTGMGEEGDRQPSPPGAAHRHLPATGHR